MPSPVHRAPKPRLLRFPFLTAVIPARPGSPPPRALEALGRLCYPRTLFETFVVRGTQPARQRNEAARHARGEILVFLDDDSEPSSDLFLRYAASFQEDPCIGAVGGPAEPAGGNRLQALSALLLGDPWVIGRSAARYRALGELRTTDERELILCNLAVRRSAFDEVGGFDESLYPNEENDLLDRMARRGWKLLYDPGAVVRRPHRETMAALLRAVFGYGRGRAEQWRRLPSRSSRGRGALAAAAASGALLAAAAPLAESLLCFVPAALYAAYLSALALRFSRRRALWDAIAASGLVGLVHASYAAGLLWGLLVPARRGPGGAVEIERVDTEGLKSRRPK